MIKTAPVGTKTKGVKYYRLLPHSVIKIINAKNYLYSMNICL